MSGRCQQTEPKAVKSIVVPLKQSRKSEIQPTFYGFHMQHCRWFKQLRRLQNYCVWVRDRDVTDVQGSVHGIGLWRSILNSPGFSGGFASWWPSRNYKCPNDPVVMPSHVPRYEVAVQIFDAFRCEVRLLETRLQAAHKQRRRDLRARDPKLLFRDVKRQPPQPVETLVQASSCHVVSVDLDFHGLVVDSLPCFDVQRPVVIQGRSHELIAHDTDTIWVDDATQVRPGDRVVQSKYVGELPALFEAFHEQWRKRWCRHDLVPTSQWQQLLDFARRTFPGVHVPVVSLDAALLRAEASRKKKRSATGLDGLSRDDVLLCDENVATSLVSVTDRACRDGVWPKQVVAGKVVSLAKTPDAQEVNQYRPVTVFSFLYRCWSSLNARALLDSADTWSHADIFGNRKGRQASHLWRELVHAVEDAYDRRVPLSGITADIEKAFNCLPRYPIICMALHAGASFQTLMGWSGGLGSMIRHFRVQSSFSPGFLTSTGLAEGCGLSCYGMLLLDHVMHHWLEAQHSRVRALSYVDNLDLLTSDPSVAIRQLDFLLEFASMADLTVDRKKTFGWSVDANIRRQFKEANIPVQHWARDLGAHIGFSRQFTNSTVVERFKALADLWPKLKGSPAPHRQKLHVLRSVAWSRGLHAISSASVGQSQWLQLRRKATDALGYQRYGVNPLLYLGLVEHADPEHVAILSTVKDSREFLSVHTWNQILVPYAAGDSVVTRNSPCGILVDRLQPLGFRFDLNGLVGDRFGAFDLLGANFAEVSLRLQWAWEQFVASRLSHRPEFVGLSRVDAVSTRKKLQTLNVSQQALMRLQLSGAFFTADVEENWRDGPGLCQWCGQEDSMKHRFWDCPQTQALRVKYAPSCADIVDDLPAALSLHSWALQPPVWHQWISLLCNREPKVPSLFTGFSQGWNQVFTDGSCFFQADSRIRLASWAAVLVSASNPAWNFPAGHVLAAEPLVGLCQTSFRAELFAVAFVLHHAALCRVSVVIWTDCLGVYYKYQLLSRGKLRVRCNSANADLWKWIAESVDSLGTERIQVNKVAAHRPVAEAKTRHEAWLFWNNGCADRAAKYANLNRSQDEWAMWRTLVAQTAGADHIYTEVTALHTAVASMSVQTSKRDVTDQAQLRPPRQAREFEKCFELGPWNGRSLSADFAQRYGGELARRIQRWWTQRVVRSDSEPRWITFCHLYVDYQMTFGCPGPQIVNKQVVDPMTRPFLDAGQTPFNVRVRWFRSCVLWFLQAHGIKVGLATTRGESDVLQSYLACASLHWDPWCLQTAEQWLSSNLQEPCLRGSKALQNLPLVAANSAMTIGTRQ